MDPFSQQSQRPQSSPPSGIFSGPPYVHVPRSHKGIVRAVVIIVLLALVGVAGYWAYQKYLSPPALALASSNKYVNALTTDDVDWAAYLSAENADFSLLESAAQAVKGGYKLADSAEKNGNYYFLYDLTNATSKHARTVVLKTDKGYRVSSFVYSSDSLALMPEQEGATPGVVSAVVASDAGTGASSTGSVSPNTGSGSGSASGSSTGGRTGGSGPVACLAQPDYGKVFADGESEDGTAWTASSPYAIQISFSPGSTDYIDDFETGDTYALWVKFYQTFPSRNYTIHVAGDYTGDASLADRRAAKTAGALAAVGIPAGKIITENSAQVTLDDDDSDGYVTMSIVPGNGC